MNYLLATLVTWIIAFITTFFLFYFISENYPRHPVLNSLIVCIFGLIFAYLLGTYLFNLQLIMVPIFF